jgi:ATP/maltotriose-dependent transcriptional regulator MalT
VLEINHWLLQTLIFKTRNIKEAYPLAVETAVEARKPEYADMQEHICVYQDLILTYIDTDPIGHEKLIEEAVDYMQEQVGNRNIQCRLCLQGLRCDFEIERGNLDQGEEECHRQMSLAENNAHRHHHQTQIYTSLMQIAYLRGDWDEMMTYAGIAVEMSGGDEDLIVDYCTCLLGQAFVYAKQGETAAAETTYTRAIAAAERTGTVMSKLYYDLLRAYHEQNGDDEAILRVTDHELDEIDDKGQLYRESAARIARCSALKRLGRLTDYDLQAAREVIVTLKAPQQFSEALEELTSR